MAPVPRRPSFIDSFLAAAFGMRHAVSAFWFAHDAEAETEWPSIIPFVDPGSGGISNLRRTEAMCGENWVDAGIEDHPPLSYKLDPTGWVYLRGVITYNPPLAEGSGAEGDALAFSLPLRGVVADKPVGNTNFRTMMRYQGPDRPLVGWQFGKMSAVAIEGTYQGNKYGYIKVYLPRPVGEDDWRVTVPLNGMVLPIDPPQ